MRVFAGALTLLVAMQAGSAAAPADRGWQLTIGPYLWMSSVDADVEIAGGLSAGVDIGFLTLARHSRYGAQILAEARNGRFALTGDVMYGAAAVTGSTDIGPAMASLTGRASSLTIDAAAGYEVFGDERSIFSLEVRGGIRYQRTVVNGELEILGLSLQTPDSINDSSDGLLGARAGIQPARWLRVSGMFDVGVIGSSDRTWSAAVTASVAVTHHVLLTAGWRTLTTQSAHISIAMHGPLVAAQLVF